MFRETIPVYTDNYMKTIYVICGKKEKMSMVKAGGKHCCFRRLKQNGAIFFVTLQYHIQKL
jgi:hypothetical protein